MERIIPIFDMKELVNVFKPDQESPAEGPTEYLARIDVPGGVIMVCDEAVHWVLDSKTSEIGLVTNANRFIPGNLPIPKSRFLEILDELSPVEKLPLTEFIRDFGGEAGRIHGNYRTLLGTIQNMGGDPEEFQRDFSRAPREPYTPGSNDSSDPSSEAESSGPEARM